MDREVRQLLGTLYDSRRDMVRSRDSVRYSTSRLYALDGDFIETYESLNQSVNRIQEQIASAERTFQERSDSFTDAESEWKILTGSLEQPCLDCLETTIRDEDGEPNSNHYLVQHNHREICTDCRDAYYFECYSCDCEDHMDSDVMWRSEVNDEYYCEDCYYDTFSHCEGCGTEEFSDDLRWDEEDEYPYCQSCCEDNSRNSQPDWEVQDNIDNLSCGISQYDKHYAYFGDTDENVTTNVRRYLEDETFDYIKSKRWLGLELELHAYCESLEDIGYVARNSITETLTEEHKSKFDGSWKGMSGTYCEYDGSITGSDDEEIRSGEVVFAPRRGDYFIRDSKLVTKALKSELNAFVTSRCGVHLHLDARDFDWYHRIVLTAFVKLFEPHLYSWLPPSRRTGSYSRPISQMWNAFEYVKDRESFINFWYDTNRFSMDKLNGKRYYGLNHHSSFYYEGPGSIEMRYHQGSLNAEKIKHWAILWTNVFDKSKEIANKLMDKANSGSTNRALLAKELVSGLYDVNHMNFLSDSERDNENLFWDTLNRKSRTDEVCKARLEYFKKVVKRFEIPKANHRRLWNMNLQTFCSTLKPTQPIISIDNFFEVMEIPASTRAFYANMLKERLSNASTPDTHYNNCFYRNQGVVEFDVDKLAFNIVDYETDRIILVKDNPFVDPNDMRRSSKLSYSHVNYTLLGDIVEEFKNLPYNITYGKLQTLSSDGVENPRNLVRNSLFSYSERRPHSSDRAFSHNGDNYRHF